MIVENNPDSINLKSKDNLTVLHYACRHSNYDILEFLIKSGADVNAKSGIGQTPLHVAASHNHPENVRILLSYGADPNSVSLDGDFSPLHVACNSKSFECASLLIRRQNDLNLQVIFYLRVFL